MAPDSSEVEKEPQCARTACRRAVQPNPVERTNHALVGVVGAAVSNGVNACRPSGQAGVIETAGSAVMRHVGTDDCAHALHTPMIYSK